MQSLNSRKKIKKGYKTVKQYDTFHTLLHVTYTMLSTITAHNIFIAGVAAEKKCNSQLN